MRRSILLFAAAITSPAVAQDHHGDMDHSTMDQSTMDHSAAEQSAPDEAMPDHAMMGQSGMEEPSADQSEMDHAEMDHRAMGHSPTDMPPESSGQDQAMDHSMHGGHAMPTESTASDVPGNALPPPVAGDHAADAIFGSSVMAQSRRDLLAGMRFTSFTAGFDMLELRLGDGEERYAFEGAASYGGDIDRAVLAFKGEGELDGAAETVELDAYWRHALDPWFNLQLGARQDFRPDPERTYALIGIDGLAPYWIEVEAQAFISEKGDVHLRGTAMHDMRITQHVVFEPEVKIDVAMQDVPELGIGSGLESFELSGRLRYEIKRNFAPYVGFAWERKVGASADYARDEGEEPSRFSWVAGLRFWF